MPAASPNSNVARILALARQTPVTSIDVAERLGVPTGTASSALTLLGQRGLLKRIGEVKKIGRANALWADINYVVQAIPVVKVATSPEWKFKPLTLSGYGDAIARCDEIRRIPSLVGGVA